MKSSSIIYRINSKLLLLSKTQHLSHSCSHQRQLSMSWLYTIQ